MRSQTRPRCSLWTAPALAVAASSCQDESVARDDDDALVMEVAIDRGRAQPVPDRPHDMGATADISVPSDVGSDAQPNPVPEACVVPRFSIFVPASEEDGAEEHPVPESQPLEPFRPYLVRVVPLQRVGCRPGMVNFEATAFDGQPYVRFWEILVDGCGGFDVADNPITLAAGFCTGSPVVFDLTMRGYASPFSLEPNLVVTKRYVVE